MESIEKAFRVLKTDLDIFPMRVRKESTIRGHAVRILHIAHNKISSDEEAFPIENDSGTGEAACC